MDRFFIAHWNHSEDKPEIIEFQAELDNYHDVADSLAEAMSLSEFSCTRGNKYLILDATPKWIEIWASESYVEYRDYKIYDTDKNDFIDPNWENRDQVASLEEAITLLSIQMMDDFSRKKSIPEMNEFAEKWDIPFSPELFANFSKTFNDMYPYWDSSSSQC